MAQSDWLHDADAKDHPADSRAMSRSGLAMVTMLVGAMATTSLFVLWLGLGALTGSLAQNRGQNGLLWLVFGMVAPGLALIALLVFFVYDPGPDAEHAVPTPTIPSARLTRSCAPGCRPNCSTCWRGSTRPSCSSPMTSTRRSGSRTASRC